MKCDELNVYKGDVTIPVYGTIADAEVYLKKEADEAIAELKDKCQMHDFFWEGCGFAKRGFKNTIAVSEAFDKLEAENALLKERICNGDVSRLTWIDDCIAKDKEITELKKKLESVQASMYADMVDANMENRRLKCSLWLARAERAKEHVWHDVKTDGSPRDDYKGHDWVLVQHQENGGFLLIPRIAEYRKNLKRWVLIDEDDIKPHHDYLLKYCRVIGWRDIDFAYYGRKFFVQQEINKSVERKCRAKAEEYK